MHPGTDDVLVSRREASLEHEVLIVPGQVASVFPTHDSAVAHARDLARSRQVDAWLTEDHIHFMRIATYRGPSETA